MCFYKSELSHSHGRIIITKSSVMSFSEDMLYISSESGGQLEYRQPDIINYFLCKLTADYMVKLNRFKESNCGHRNFTLQGFGALSWKWSQHM